MKGRRDSESEPLSLEPDLDSIFQRVRARMVERFPPCRRWFDASAAQDTSVSGHKLAHEYELQKQLRHFRLLADNSIDLICRLDLSGRFDYVSPAARKLTGREPDALLDTSLFELVHRSDLDVVRRALADSSEGDSTVSYRLLRQDGTPVWVESSFRAMDDDEDRGVACITRDITEHRRVEEDLGRVARLDSLTGLPNRLRLTERIDASILGATRRGDRFALVMFDLDRFKIVNDTLGHSAGDDLLRAVSRRLQQVLRASDMLARWGGDEFVLLITRLMQPEEAEALTQACLLALAPPLTLRGRVVHVGASAGIAVYPDAGRSETELLRNADMAMYRAKEIGAGSVVMFSTDLAERSRQRLTIESDLHGALREQQFELYYQPIISATTLRIEAVEALIRWHHPNGMVRPDLFIPIAEESGLIVPIGTWVLQESCAFTARLVDAGLAPPGFYISVNVSALQFRHGDFPELMRQTLSARGLHPESLQLELTESAIMTDPEVATAAMQRIRDLGVQIAIDDFGTGYSSLAYLARFPASGLKIDRSFVNNMSPGSAGSTIVQATLAIADKLGMKVTAEGVETVEQRDALIALGCQRLQGYLFDKPLTADQFQARLASQKDAQVRATLGLDGRPQRARTQSM